MDRGLPDRFALVQQRSLPRAIHAHVRTSGVGRILHRLSRGARPDRLGGALPRLRALLRSHKFVFGWTAAANGGSVPTSVPESNVYSCIDVWNGDYFLNNDDDWVVFKLDRPVTGGRAPFQVRHAGSTPTNLQVGLIGYPLGVPQKVSPVGNTTATGNDFWFGNNLDMFEVNSGSPVFDRATGVVERIQIRGGGVPHFVAGTDASGACVKENVCSTTAGCTGGDFGKSFRIARISDFIPLTPAQISVAIEPITS